MRILGINGSPRTQGSTAFALGTALARLAEEGWETTALSVADLEIRPCLGCLECRAGSCVQDDGMVEVLDELRRCDGLLLASPVYMGTVSGQLKVWMDRTVPLRADGSFALGGRVGGGIACGGFRNGGQELTLQAIQAFFLQQDMYPIADGPPLCHSGAALVGDARTDDIGLDTVDFLARRMVRALGELRIR